MKPKIIVCDRCGKTVNYENRFEVYIVTKNDKNIKKYCKHELCDGCWKKFINYLAEFKD